MIGQDRHQQMLSGTGQAVHGRAGQDPALKQASLPEDAQVAARVRLLVAGDQAKITDAGLTGIVDQFEQGQASWISESLGLHRESLRLAVWEQFIGQSLGFARVRDLQMRGLVSDGA